MPLRFLDSGTSRELQKRLRRRRWLNVSLLVLSVAVLGLIVGAAFLTKSMNDVERATAERSRSNSRLREVLSIIIELTDAETGQRGYLLTGRHDYLAPYELAARELPRMMEALLEVSIEDSAVHSHLAIAAPIVEAKLQELAATIDLYKRGHQDQAIQLVDSDQGLHFTSDIRSHLAAVESEFKVRRDRAESRVLASSTSTKQWAFVTVAALLLSLGLAGYQLRSLARSRDEYEQELASKTAILNTVVDEIPSIVAVWDRNLTCRLVNKAFERWLSRDRSDLLGKHILDIAGRCEYERNLPFIEKALTGQAVRFEKDYNTGKIKHLAVSYTPLESTDGAVIGIAVLANDISDHQREKVRLQQLSESDPLTGLLNRLGFEAYAKTQVDAGLSDSLAIICIDLDEFKPVNDSYGHAAGDHVLQTIAERLSSSVRPTDGLARLGGDEFAVVLPNIRQLCDAQKIADKILEEVRKPIRWDSELLVVRASVGVAFNGDQFGDWRALLAHADAMLYAAKKSQKDSRARSR